MLSTLRLIEWCFSEPLPYWHWRWTKSAKSQVQMWRKDVTADVAFESALLLHRSSILKFSSYFVYDQLIDKLHWYHITMFKSYTNLKHFLDMILSSNVTIIYCLRTKGRLQQQRWIIWLFLWCSLRIQRIFYLATFSFFLVKNHVYR